MKQEIKITIDKLIQIIILVCLIFRFPLMVIPLILIIVEEIFMCIYGLAIIRCKDIVLNEKWHDNVATILLYIMLAIHIFYRDIPFWLSVSSIVVYIIFAGISFGLYATYIIKILISKNGNIR